MTGAAGARRSAEEWALLGASFAAALLFLPLGDRSFDRYHLVKEFALHVGALVAAVAFARRAVVTFDRLDLLVLAFAAAGALSAAAATNPWVGWRGAAVTASGAVLLCAGRRLDAGAAERTVRAAILVLAVVATLALVECYGLLKGLTALGRAPGSTLGQRNAVAHLLVLGLPFAWAACSGASGRAARLGFGLALAVSAAVIALSRCRAAWLALLPAVAVAALLARRRRLPTQVLPGAMVAAGILAALVLPNSLAWTTEQPFLESARTMVEHGRGSGRGRLAQWGNSFAMLRARPLFGVGPGNWQVEYPRFSSPNDPTFDGAGRRPSGRLMNGDVVALAVEYGLVGAALGLAIAVVVFTQLVTGAIRPHADSFAAASVASATALAVVATLDSVLQLAAPVALAALLLGPRLRTHRSTGETASWPRLAWVGVATALATTVLRTAMQVTALAIASSTSAGLDDLQRATRVDPTNYELQLSLGEARAAMGDCANAKPSLEAAIALFPNHDAARDLLAACSSAR